MKGSEEERRGEERRSNAQASSTLLALSPTVLLSYLPQQNRVARGGREGVLVIKLQTFPHLMVLCHVSAFLHSSLAVLVLVPPPKKKFRFSTSFLFAFLLLFF